MCRVHHLLVVHEGGVYKPWLNLLCRQYVDKKIKVVNLVLATSVQ